MHYNHSRPYASTVLKVAEKLKSLFKKDRKAFEEKWSEIRTFVKYGMISEEKFYDKATKFALFKNIDESYFTIEEYKEKIKDTQKDKHDKIVHLYSNAKKEHHSFIESAKNQGCDVLEMDTVIDNHFMQHLETKKDKLSFVRGGKQWGREQKYSLWRMHFLT